MRHGLSPRLAAVVDALPLEPHLRVLEIGCGPGAAARAVAGRLTTGYVLAVDRSVTAVAQARALAADQIAAGRMDVRLGGIEDFSLGPDEQPFDLVFAVRVGAFDGRQPKVAGRALERVARAMTSDGRFFIDAPDGSGRALQEVRVPR